MAYRVPLFLTSSNNSGGHAPVITLYSYLRGSISFDDYPYNPLAFRLPQIPPPPPPPPAIFPPLIGPQQVVLVALLSPQASPIHIAFRLPFLAQGTFSDPVPFPPLVGPLQMALVAGLSRTLTVGEAAFRIPLQAVGPDPVPAVPAQPQQQLFYAQQIVRPVQNVFVSAPPPPPAGTGLRWGFYKYGP